MPERADGASRLMKQLGQRYVQHVNRTQARSGTLWEGRFRSCLVAAEDYLLNCCRYIGLNPVRAGMVRHPADYRWSSHRANAEGAPSTVLTPHPLFASLGATAAARQAAYRELSRRRPRRICSSASGAPRTAAMRSAPSASPGRSLPPPAAAPCRSAGPAAKARPRRRASDNAVNRKTWSVCAGRPARNGWCKSNAAKE